MAEENKIILDADVKPLKKQLREATQELQVARQRYGEFSTEAVNAAKKVAVIRDEIEAANEAAALFDPGKRFEALTTAASTAAGGIAAVQGAMALFGGESEEVEKALLKVQGALALSQGLSQLKDIGKVTEQLKISFKGLGTSAKSATSSTDGLTKSTKGFGKAIIATGVGALVAALGLLIANFDKVKEVMMKLFPVFEELGKFIGGLITGFTDFIGLTNEAERNLEALGKSNEKLNDDINNKIKLLSAQGGKEKEIYDLRRKQIDNELALIQETSKVKGELTDEEQKRQKELLTENAVEAANYYKFTAEQEKAAAEKSKAAAEKAKAEADKRRSLELEAQGILEDSKLELLDQRQQEEAAVEKEFEAKRKKLKEAGIEDDGSLEMARLARLAEIDKQYKEEAESQEADFEKRLNDIRTEIRLAGIKDENEKAREQILLDFESKRQDVLANEKLTADQRTALILALKDQENQQLKDLQFSIDEANAVRELEKLDAQMKEAEKDFNFQKSLLDQKQALLDKQYEDDLISQEKYNEATKANSNARKEIDKAEYEFKISQAQAAANVLGALSDLAGKQTAAGKALGISQALINTYVGVSDVLQAKSVLPSPFDVIAKVANVATILATGLKAVKAITAVKVPGGGGGGGGVSAPSISATAPTVSSSVPTLGTSPVTALNTAMQQQPPVRAYVVESEVTGSQKRVADIERRAGF
jgi:hypothetical protein